MTICFGLDPLEVVLNVPYGITVGSVSEVGPETVEVISHHKQRTADATCTAPQAYLEQFFTCEANAAAAERTPSNSELVGTFAKTSPFARKLLGGQVGDGEGETLTALLT